MKARSLAGPDASLSRLFRLLLLDTFTLTLVGLNVLVIDRHRLLNLGTELGIVVHTI